MSQKKKKLGYSEYEDLLADAHRKLDFLAEKFQEFQTYFVGYIEFHEENVEFHDWMEQRINEARDTHQEPAEEESELPEYQSLGDYVI